MRLPVFRVRSLIFAAIAGGLIGASVRAATPEEEAGAAAREYAKAVSTRDIDTQLKLLPRRLFAKPGDREREEKRLTHDKELAVINGERYLVFDVQQKPTSTGKVGNQLVLVFPYRSVVQNRDAKFQRDSSLIAFAEAGSSEWSVIDGTAQNTKSMKIFLPGYAGNPPIPRPVTKSLAAE
jgi:hypothetical protein